MIVDKTQIFTKIINPIQNKLKTKPCRSIKAGLLSDVFERTGVDLKNIKRGSLLNSGHSYNVYETNYSDYVLRVNKNFLENKNTDLLPVNDKSDILFAHNINDTVQVLKKVRGEPLYGKGWDLNKTYTTDTFLVTFEKIKNLPDKSFEDYIYRIIELRKTGHEIDTINPNNFLLDGENISIIDVEFKKVEPKISIEDFYPLIDEKKLPNILKSLPLNKRNELVEDIRLLLTRFVKICKRNGQNTNIERVDYSKLQNIVTYIYYNDKYALDRLI